MKGYLRGHASEKVPLSWPVIRAALVRAYEPSVRRDGRASPRQVPMLGSCFGRGQKALQCVTLLGQPSSLPRFVERASSLRPGVQRACP